MKPDRAALPGLGAGTEHPALHSPCFDLPDALREAGARLLSAIIVRVSA